jgi:hypothetical protein
VNDDGLREVLHGRFGSFIELNAWLTERCRSVWSDTTHPIHRQLTLAEMWELETLHLMSMPAPVNGYVERLARVSSTCLVAAARNRYSVAWADLREQGGDTTVAASRWLVEHLLQAEDAERATWPCR